MTQFIVYTLYLNKFDLKKNICKIGKTQLEEEKHLF